MRQFVDVFCWTPESIKAQIERADRFYTPTDETDTDRLIDMWLHGEINGVGERFHKDLKRAEIMREADNLAELAEAAFDSGDFLAAQVNIDKSLTLIEKVAEHDNVCLATAFVNSGDILLKTGLFDEAAEAFQKAVKLLEAALSEGELLDYSKNALLTLNMPPKTFNTAEMASFI